MVQDRTRNKWESRKLAIALGFEFLATGLLIAGLIEAEHWVTVTMTILASYMASQGYVDGQK